MSDLETRGDFRQFAAAAARVGRIPETGRAGIVTSMHRVVFVGERLVKERVSVDTANYRRTITTRVDVLPKGVIGRIGSNAPYGRTRELGRRPHKPMPPAGVLIPWMRRHGLGTDPGLEFLIRRAIGRRGIPGEHVFERTIHDLIPICEAEFRNVRFVIAASMRGSNR